MTYRTRSAALTFVLAIAIAVSSLATATQDTDRLDGREDFGGNGFIQAQGSRREATR